MGLAASVDGWCLALITDEAFPARRIDFVVEGEPATKSRARVTMRAGKVHAYTPEPTKRAEAAMRAAFLETVGRLAPSDRHAFGVEATFHMASGIRRDVDNMLKIVLDGLNKVAWKDDYQVTEVLGRKRACAPGEARTEVAIYTAGVLVDRIATCQWCDKGFPRPPSHAAKKFCSDECRRAARLSRLSKSCPQCRETFTPTEAGQVHCSRPCSDASKRVAVICAKCSAPFTKPRSVAGRSSRHYCGECDVTPMQDVTA